MTTEYKNADVLTLKRGYDQARTELANIRYHREHSDVQRVDVEALTDAYLQELSMIRTVCRQRVAQRPVAWGSAICFMLPREMPSIFA